MSKTTKNHQNQPFFTFLTTHTQSANYCNYQTTKTCQKSSKITKIINFYYFLHSRPIVVPCRPFRPKTTYFRPYFQTFLAIGLTMGTRNTKTYKSDKNVNRSKNDKKCQNRVFRVVFRPWAY